MSSLGERLAVAYGWEREVPPGDVTLWLVGSPTYYMTTPDPENSWQHFGAMLEWAKTQGPQPISAMRDALINFGMPAHGDWSWERFRRVVTEAILEALDA